MTKYEKAATIMPALRVVAAHRSTITYGQLAMAIGIGNPVGLGQWLSPIQDYCAVHGLPPLTVLVVNETTGLPGEGYRRTRTVALDREAVYAHDWLPRWIPGGPRQAPTPEEFEAAEAEYRHSQPASAPSLAGA